MKGMSSRIPPAKGDIFKYVQDFAIAEFRCADSDRFTGISLDRMRSMNIIRPWSKSYSTGLIESFVKYVSVYPVGTGVMLNTKERGIVVRDNRSAPTRPVVRIVYNSKMQKQSIYKEIDLSMFTNVFIVDGCEV